MASGKSWAKQGGLGKQVISEGMRFTCLEFFPVLNLTSLPIDLVPHSILRTILPFRLAHPWKCRWN